MTGFSFDSKGDAVELIKHTNWGSYYINLTALVRIVRVIAETIYKVKEKQ